MSAFTIKQMIINSWIILSILFFCSVLCIAVVWNRRITFKKARINSEEFIKQIRKLLSDGNIDKAIAHCQEMKKPLALVAKSILEESGDRKQKERVMTREIKRQIGKLESYIPILGTVGGIAPFIGLFGTVIGIIQAFQAISISMAGGPGVVAAGIAKALITTAMGLFVAIPSVIAYNYFVNKLRKLSREIEISAEEILEITISILYSPGQ